MAMNKYKDGTTKEQIIYDGWSRGFDISQVIDEVNDQGFTVTHDEVKAAYNKHQDEMEYCFMNKVEQS